MPDVVFAIPGDLEGRTGGYAYDRQVLAFLPKEGFAVRHLPLPGSFPDASAADLAETLRALTATPADSVILFDGLAYSALPDDLIRSIGRRIVALVHHPLAYEPGLTEEKQRSFRRSERNALALAQAVVVSSPTTHRVLVSEFGVPACRITVAEPGTERAARARGSSGTPFILAVGAVSVRKGYAVLIEALAGLRDRAWRATIAGNRDRDPATAASLERTIAKRGLSERVALVGQVDDPALAALYDAADLFVMPSLYEGYGMVLAEAMAHGLAIVSTIGGAAAETVPDGAALKVPPNDPGALASAIAQLLDDLPLRRCVADASWVAGQALPHWGHTAAMIARAIRRAAR